MVEEKQLTLFNLSPMDEGKEKINLGIGGLAELQINNFKGIHRLTTKFDPITLLVGANNSGKSTVLQAIRLFYYCVERCGFLHPTGEVILKKHVMPFTSFALIPAHDIKELVTNGITPSSRKRGIYLLGELRSGQRFDFTIYSAYSTLLVIQPGDLSPKTMTMKEFESASRQPLYVPGFSGVVTKEFLSTNQRVEELLGSGHHNEVLRNLILRLQPSPDLLKSLTEILWSEFSVRFEGIQGDPNKAEYLQAAYREGALRIPLDIVSAGSGFLQVLQILTHALQSPSPVLLIDEPDAHMHTQLQEHFIKLLRTFANDYEMQIIMASHSETFTRTMELSEIRLIDRQANRSDSFSDPAAMKAELNSHGVWPDEPELTEALRIQRILLCESSLDADLISAFAIIHTLEWKTTEKKYQAIPTQGANDQIVARMQAIVEILNKLLNGVNVVYLRDRDLMCDERKESAEQESKEKGLDLVITERRNRESYLVEPKVVESAVLSQGNKIPREWAGNGTISNLVKKWCLEFCYEQYSELPTKVDEYNQHWLRTQIADDTARREAATRLEAFTKNNWYNQIDAKEIPWKLMDGRGALKYVRQKLQEKKIILPESLLLNHLGATSIPNDFVRLIDIIKAWN